MLKASLGCMRSGKRKKRGGVQWKENKGNWMLSANTGCFLAMPLRDAVCSLCDWILHAL